MIEPDRNRGLRVQLSEYKPLRDVSGIENLWSVECQRFLRNPDTGLNRFLPRAIPEGSAEAIFEMSVGPLEVASGSRGLQKNAKEIPETERAALQEAVKRLQDQATQPTTTADTRRWIESFKLPDPQSSPEMYRLYGPFWNRRLLVLWGCENPNQPPIKPQDALDQLRNFVDPFARGRSTLALLGLILLLLLLAALAWFLTSGTPKAPDTKPATTDTKQAVTAPAGTNANRLVEPPAVDITIPHGQYFEASPRELKTGEPVNVKSSHPGTVDFNGLGKMKLDGIHPRAFDRFIEPGNFRVEWQPDEITIDGKPANNESAMVKVRSDSDPHPSGPVASLVLSPNPAKPKQPVIINPKPSFHGDPDHKLAKYEYSVDGGNLRTIDIDHLPTESFDSPGEHTIALVVTDDQGKQAKTSQKLSVQEKPIEIPDVPLPPPIDPPKPKPSTTPATTKKPADPSPAPPVRAARVRILATETTVNDHPGVRCEVVVDPPQSVASYKLELLDSNGKLLETKTTSPAVFAPGSGTYTVRGLVTLNNGTPISAEKPVEFTLSVKVKEEFKLDIK